MLSLLRVFLATSAVILLSACASTPDPAEICSSEWIGAQSENAIERIEKRSKSSIKAFTSVAKTWAEGKNPNFIQEAKLAYSVSKMKRELTRGQGIKDLKTIAKTCNDPKIVGDSMRGLLERSGLNQNHLQWLENNPIYQILISSITAPEPVKSNG